MTSINFEALRYPIGRYQKLSTISAEILHTYHADISTFPDRLKKEIEGLNDEQLDTPYRPEGWTLRQVVHHCADSHMNAFIRFKLALTEDHPTIRPYKEDRWAEGADVKNLSLKPSLSILEGLHERWSHLLASLTQTEWARTFYHPESDINYRLDEAMGLYAWHCNHHLAHITGLKQRRNW